VTRSKKSDLLQHQLSRRERQIMGAVYRLGEASVADVAAHIPSPPTRDAVRRLCNILEEKGLLRSRPQGKRKVYSPAVNPRTARHSALENLIETFFGGSPHMLVATLLDARRDELSAADVARLTKMIDAAEKKKE
jgi:predicted transcriptional regulator